MTGSSRTTFDAAEFLSTPGQGRSLISVAPAEVFFQQGEAAESLYYVRSGRAKLTVVSDSGKEAILAQIAPGDFLGETAMGTGGLRHRATAVAVTTCIALKISREAMLTAIHKESTLSDLFLAALVLRSGRVEADLIDHLFNSSERRLARVLLLMAEVGESETLLTMIPQITQETLAEMVGTTRSRVSYFMNRFRVRGFVEYNGRIRVRTSLLRTFLENSSVVLAGATDLF